MSERMCEPDIFPRFAALHRVVARMGYFAPVEATHPLAIEMLEAVPSPRSRPSTAQAQPVEWIRAEQMHEALARHSLRRAELRAGREIADERTRMTQTVNQLREAERQNPGRRRADRWTNGGQGIAPTIG